MDEMANLVGNLLKAQNVAKMWHWKVKRLSQHLALGELYDSLDKLTDQLAEMYMGKYGTEFHIVLSDPNPFSEQDPLEFVMQLDKFLEDQKEQIPQDGFIINKYEELQGDVSTVLYKLQNLQ